MIGGSFAVGQRIKIGDASFRVMRDLGKGKVVIEELSTGRLLEKAISDLLLSWKKGDVMLGDGSVTPESAIHEAIRSAHIDAFQQSYSEDQQAQAKARLKFVEVVEKLPRNEKIVTPIIKEIWSDAELWKKSSRPLRCPHFTTVLNWVNAYVDSGRDIRSLVDQDGRKGNRRDRNGCEVRQIAMDAIETLYLKPERQTIKDVHKYVCGSVLLRNATRIESEQLNIPSYGYIKSLVSELNPYEVYRARYGQRAADIKFRAAGQAPVAERPLARAAMDHTQMDVFVVDEQTGLPLGRPWLTMVIDECTRYVLGYYLGFEAPGAISLTRALRNALVPKEVDPEIKSSWDAWGLMDVLVVDNGMEFHSMALESAGGRFGIDVQFCPRKAPWFKGKIERLFGTLNTGLLAGIGGKTFSNHLLKGDYNPEKNAVLTLDVLQRMVQMWIVDVYHQEIHSSLDASPSLCWEEGIGSVDRYLPSSAVVIESAFSNSTTRWLTHKGLEFDRVFYNNQEMRALREQFGERINVEIRTWDDDIGHIVVVAPDQRTLIKVPAVNLDYADGLTRWQHKVCKRYQRRVLEDDVREISLFEARERIRDLIAASMQFRSRKTRSAQQRFLGDAEKVNQESNTMLPQTETRPAVLTNEPALPAPAKRAASDVDQHSASSAPHIEKSIQPPSDPVLEDGEVPTFKSRKRASEEVA